MRIAGLMALREHPLWFVTLRKLCDICNAVWVRYDVLTGNPYVYRQCDMATKAGFFPKVKRICRSNTKWNNWNWREEMMRYVDNDSPDIVICLDEDECFESDPHLEIKQFYSSSRKEMVFSYRTPLEIDGKIVDRHKAFPSKPHAKIYKWCPGLTFHPYPGRAHTATYKGCKSWESDIRILHYALFDDVLRQTHKKTTIAKMLANEVDSEPNSA